MSVPAPPGTPPAVTHDRKLKRREDANMMAIDMTAQLGWLMTVLNALLVVTGAAIAARMWIGRSAVSRHDVRTASTMAVVGSSSSAPSSREEETPSDTSVPEAA
jgi:hypothetical protein